ncbi:helix-turn-helix domain-containing protein [Candidatus Methylopumilus planktonicus]|uniref:helix-turn-helix domain-containing protein n=1 Tax=Candidatus Methylopumilus planktonicus TaxID=1581557 RepID=UPI003BEF0E48
MDKLEYNCDLLRTARESKKITAHSIAVDICLAERQIKSLEENSLQYFPSESIKYTALKKYIAALGLKIDDVIVNINQIDPIPSLLKKK